MVNPSFLSAFVYFGIRFRVILGGRVRVSSGGSFRVRVIFFGLGPVPDLIQHFNLVILTQLYQFSLQAAVY